MTKGCKISEIRSILIREVHASEYLLSWSPKLLSYQAFNKRILLLWFKTSCFRLSDGKLPHPEQILFTSTSVNDLTLYKQAWLEIKNRMFFGDKIYNNNDLFTNMENKFNSEMLTPVKGVKGMSEALKKFDRAAMICITKL